MRILYLTPLILVSMLSACGHRPTNLYQASYYSEAGLSSSSLAEQNRLNLQASELNSGYRYTVNEDPGSLNAAATSSSTKPTATATKATKSKKTSTQTPTKKSTSLSQTGSKTVAKLSSASSLVDIMPVQKMSGAQAVSLR